MKRIIAHLITVAFTLSVLVNKLLDFDNNPLQSMWSLPFLLSSCFIAFFLIVSLARKPKGINESIPMFVVSVLASNLPFLVAKIGLFYPIMPQNVYIAMAAAIVMMLTLPFYFVAIFNLGERLTILPEANSLRTDGIYKISRHPIYVTYITWYILQIFIYQSWMILFLSTLSIALQIIRAKKEEEILEEIFPDYNAYKSRVMWLGRRNQA